MRTTRRPPRDRPRAGRRSLAVSAAPLVLALVIAIVGAARADAAGWVLDQALGDVELLGGPVAAATPDGTILAAWTAADPLSGAPVAQLRRVDPSGIVRPVETLGPAGATAPVLALGAGGGLAAAWSGPRRGDGEPMVTVHVTGGGRSSTAFLAEPAGAAELSGVRVGLDDAHRATAAWLRTDAVSGSASAIVQRVGLSSAREVARQLSTPGADAWGLDLAVAPDGRAWVSWIERADAPDAVAVARLQRLGADGAPDGPALALSGDAVALGRPRPADSATRVALAGDTAVVVWTERVHPAAYGVLRGARVPARGSDALDRLPDFERANDVHDLSAPLAHGDGTVTVAWLEGGPAGQPTVGHTAPVAGTNQRTWGVGHGRGAGLTAAPAPDGSLWLAWRAADGAQVAQIAPRGTAQRTDRVSARTEPLPPSAAVAVDGAGAPSVVLAGVGATRATSALRTARLDREPPRTLVPLVPDTAVAGEEVSFHAVAGDRGGIAGLRWTFGDGGALSGEEVVHAYAEPGTYAVELTATDTAGNQRVEGASIEVLPGPPPPAPPRLDAALKLGTVARKGPIVRIGGRLARRAGGAVVVRYAQRVGRRTIVLRRLAPIANTRFSVRLRLTGRLARARGGRATVTVRYAGDADTMAAVARRTIAVPKATHPAASRGGARGRRAPSARRAPRGRRR